VVFWVVMLCGILPPYAVKKVSFLCSVSFPWKSNVHISTYVQG
jgi:hypothetical protein